MSGDQTPSSSNRLFAKTVGRTFELSNSDPSFAVSPRGDQRAVALCHHNGVRREEGIWRGHEADGKMDLDIDDDNAHPNELELSRPHPYMHRNNIRSHVNTLAKTRVS